MSYSTDTPDYKTHTGKLVEVYYERTVENCIFGDITLLCTYFAANNRVNRLRSKSKSFIGNETYSNNYLYSDSDKLKSVIEKEPKIFNDEKHITAVLKDLGFVSINDKYVMYMLHPLKMIYFHDAHKHQIQRYSPKSYFSPKRENSTTSSKGYIQKRRHTNPVLSNTSMETNCYDKNNKNENQHQNEHLYTKYWSMRYSLFSKFDCGIRLDTESFYSVCPEVLSYHIAKRCKNNVVLDPFCGAGGNIIQLALTCKQVIAIDIDPTKIQFAQHNAEIYGVADKIQFIVGDIFSVYKMLKADVVFMSPPWGGPEYSIDKCYTIESMCSDHFGGGYGIFNIVKNIAPNIAFHMPKTTNILECMWLANDFGKLEIQQNIINGKLNSITAFYGDFL